MYEKNLSLTDDLHIIRIILCPFSAPFSHLTSCTPAKYSLYFPNSLATVFNEPALYRIQTFHVPNLISLYRCLGRARESVNFRGPYKYFPTNIYFFTVGGGLLVQPPQAGGPPPVGCLLPLIQYIRSRILYPQPEDTPCRGEKGPTYHGIPGRGKGFFL
jgi:hypothetical protein